MGRTLTETPGMAMNYEYMLKCSKRLFCPLCAAQGDVLYRDLEDGLYGVAGKWTVYRCSSCNLHWLYELPPREAVPELYKVYYTHETIEPGNVLSKHTKFGSIESFLTKKAARIRALYDETVQQHYLGYAREIERQRGVAQNIIRTSAIVFGWVPFLSERARMEVIGLRNIDKGKLLDVGCGSGDLIFRLKNLGWTVQGQEIDKSAANIAKSKMLEVECAKLDSGVFAAETYDYIILSHVLEHAYSAEEQLQDCANLLKRGGKIIILTPNSRSLGHRMMGRNWRGLEPPRHFQIFDEKNLKTLLDDSGFDVTYLRTKSRMMKGIWYASKKNALRQVNKQTTILDYLCAHAMGVSEKALCAMGFGCGEEVHVVARKRG